jgi:hypothetical protein
MILITVGIGRRDQCLFVVSGDRLPAKRTRYLLGHSCSSPSARWPKQLSRSLRNTSRAGSAVRTGLNLTSKRSAARARETIFRARSAKKDEVATYVSDFV